MADFTKAAIKQTFLLLLNKSPLSEISVKDITSECGLSRNSFYYHYRDIPELIDNIVDEYASSIVEKYSTFGSVGEYFNYIIDILLAHKKEAMHIYRSVDRSTFDRLLTNTIERFVTKHVQTVLADVTVSSETEKTIICFYKCFYFGILSEWLSREMGEGCVDEIRRLFTAKNQWTAGLASFLESQN